MADNISAVSSAGTTTTGLTNGQVMGKDDFLKLLVTQLNYQDPMNPMQSQDFAAQLAQFSSVEQLQNINTKLESSLEATNFLSQSINNTLSTTLIGREVRAAGNAVILKDGSDSADFTFDLAANADDVTVSIYDSSGLKIYETPAGAMQSGQNSFTWNGHDQDGNQVPAGNYSFHVSASLDGSQVTVTPYYSGKIDGVKYEGGMAILTSNGRDIIPSDIIEIMEAETIEPAGTLFVPGSFKSLF